ncbi:MAG: FeoB-associated Cys-rich membrane protein [Clostridia bacterium]|nr:FeoB-associated Cys-rich membrane protein [Clostridia bacterium]
MINIILILILAAIAGAVIFYLYRQKKRGVTCVGCPYAKQCSGKCSCGEEKK